MNTNNIKKYAPKARREFMDAVAKRLNTFGITANKKGELQIAEANLQGSVLQIAGNSFDGKLAEPRKRIVARSQKLGYAQLIEQVAYTWFNRLCAIRYMEIHDYLGHGFRVLSYPASHPDNSQGAGATNKGRFEIIDHAQDAADELGLDRVRIIELKLAGNKDEELYRELLLGQCHKLHEAMPFLFDALDDETEFLLPDNLTRTDSILRGLVDGIPEEDWQQVEVIGWLYQFYISEKKDQVMGKVVKSEDIPAATQLFTPNWIVKYLVQNSVGRQWLQTYPDSAIKSQMEYYIEPAEQSDEVNQQLKAITPESIEPETIKVLDPACGSGHILIEAYNVLKAIYEERGFRSRDIPKMILENNLYGLDIDDRAAQLSGFALMMMARDDDKRIFTRNVRLNVLSLQESYHIDLPTLWKALNLSGSWQSGTSQGLFSDDEQDLSSFNADNRYQLLKRTLARFTQAKTFGSLIDVPSDEHEQLKELLSTLVGLQESGDSMQKPAAKQLIEIVHQALVLSTRYDAVIANPPYMGQRYFCSNLKKLVDESFDESKYDLFAIFIERGLSLIRRGGVTAQVTMLGWLYLNNFERLRRKLLTSNTFLNIYEIGDTAFKDVAASVAVSLLTNYSFDGFSTTFKSDISGVSGSRDFLLYKTLPGLIMPLDISSAELGYFSNNQALENYADARQGLSTSNDDEFIKYWFEVDSRKISLNGGSKWFPVNKGGGVRRWYGNNFFVINWERDGYEVKKLASELYGSSSRTIKNTNYYFREGVTWGRVSGNNPTFRYYPEGYLFTDIGCGLFSEDIDILKNSLGLLNSSVGKKLLKLQSKNVKIETGHVKSIPFSKSFNFAAVVEQLIELFKFDWDEFELSLDFNGFSEVNPLDTSRISSYAELIRKKSLDRYSTVRVLEDKINKDVNEVVGLELSADEYTTLRNEGAIEAFDMFSSQFVVELVSVAIGNIMGRYSLSRGGLVYAYSGDIGFEELVTNGAYKTFPADEDGIIPLTDQEWFKDDATNRFREFVQVVWGEEHLQENLDFVAESLCLNAIKPKKSESALETIRRYLSTQFYKDHLKTYKKRPIYWLFSSGKQKAFECLVYLHRYNEGTLSRMRTEYVTPLLGKYDAYAEQLEKQIETADSTSEANRFKKELDALIKKQVELREFDDKLKHYADMRISLDLDDGVKVNYGKFGDLLADVQAITGSAPEDN